MAYQNPPSHTHNSGTTRDTRSREHARLQPAARSTNDSFTRRRATAHRANSPRRRTTDTNESYGRSSRREEEPEYDHDYPRYLDEPRDTYQLPLSYDRVPRSCQSANSELQRIINDPTLADAMTRLRGRISPHNRSSARQRRPTPTQQRPRAHSPDWYQQNSAPLGMSNLRRLNEERGQVHAMDRQFRQDRRYGPYDAVEWVERPQYVYEERYQQQQYQYDEYEDGSSDETLF